MYIAADLDRYTPRAAPRPAPGETRGLIHP
jgi:hypothetical protein